MSDMDDMDDMSDMSDMDDVNDMINMSLFWVNIDLLSYIIKNNNDI